MTKKWSQCDISFESRDGVMSDEQALLAAICDNPDEDTPRLMYADWLDEHATDEGEHERAELIRVQIELERMPEFGDVTTEVRRDGLVLRERALLETHSVRWLHQVPVHNTSFHPHRVQFRRGFPEAGSFHIDYLRQSAADVFAHPLLRRVGVSPINEHNLVDLLQFEWLANVRGLELSPLAGSGFAPPDWSLLGDSEKLCGLDSLALNFGGALDRDGAKRIAMNAALANVHTLSFKEESSAAAIPLLLEGLAFRSLSRLELKNFRGNRPPLPDLAANPHLTPLEELRLVGYTVTDMDIAKLTQSPFWKGLRIFEFSDGVFNRNALRQLAEVPGKQLESLTLMNNERFWGQELCGPVLWGLRSLDLSGNRFLGPEVIQYLAKCPQAVGLWNLNLGSCGYIGDATGHLLATASAFSQLRWLDLRNTDITHEAVKALVSSSQLSLLGRLNLHGCKMSRSLKVQLQDRFGDRVRL